VGYLSLTVKEGHMMTSRLATNNKDRAQLDYTHTNTIRVK